jgi:hypothetical protein
MKMSLKLIMSNTLTTMITNLTTILILIISLNATEVEVDGEDTAEVVLTRILTGETLPTTSST